MLYSHIRYRLSIVDSKICRVSSNVKLQALLARSQDPALDDLMKMIGVDFPSACDCRERDPTRR